MSNDDAFHVRNELDRVQLEAQYATKPEHLKDAIESMAVCIKAIMDSFGVYDITVRRSKIERPGGQEPGWVFESFDQAGRSLKRTVVVAPVILTVEEGTN